MKSKYKITGFARLLIFMVIFTPIAYIGASYYQGEDGIAKIKSLINVSNEGDTVEMKISKKKEEIKSLKSQLEASQKDLKRLEKEAN
jgi:septal ring factor EnvC (AmiA/AmiB activator)